MFSLDDKEVNGLNMFIIGFNPLFSVSVFKDLSSRDKLT